MTLIFVGACPLYAVPMVTKPKPGLAANVALVGLSLLVSLLLPELGYRVYLAFADPLASDRLSWWLTPVADGDFDAELGQRLSPNTTIHASIVRDGRVIGCLGDVYSTNADGLSGVTTFSDYGSADIKVVLTGDSFSRWHLGGVTIADILQRDVASATGKRAAVLNFARGGYGLLQMVDMAATQAEKLKPALIVIVLITDDLTRGRWWSGAATIDGRSRELMAAAPEDARNPDKSSDTSIIDPRATAEWCKERLRRGDRDAVVREATAFVASEIERKKLRPDVLSLDRAYFYAMLRRRISGAASPSAMPRTGAEEFSRDAHYQANRKRLRQSGVPLLFVHLPVEAELAAGRPLATGAAATIWHTVENDFETRIATYFELEAKPAAPPVYTLEPLDGHPNAAGVAFLGRILSEAIAERHALDAGVASRGLIRPQ